MMDASFKAADHLLHLNSHAWPPELVIYQVQHSLLTLVPGISVIPIHGSYSVSYGDYESQKFFQLTTRCVAMIKDSLVVLASSTLEEQSSLPRFLGHFPAGALDPVVSS